MYSGKFVVFCEKSLCSGRSGFVRESGCIRVKWLYLGKSGFIRAKMDVFGQCSCLQARDVVIGENCSIWRKWLYSGKVVVIVQTGCLRAEWL